MVLHDLEESSGFEAYGCRGGNSVDMRNSNSYMQSNWAHIAETTMPLKTSKLAPINDRNQSFQASIESRSRKISTKVITINLISLIFNLALAVAAFYFAYANNSSSTTAFAADCLLDFMSSAIILWRYYGNLNVVYMQAREQIACIYLGALFEISSLGIIIKALSDIISGTDFALTHEDNGSKELIYLAIVATVACSAATVFKCALYKTIRDNSILLDVINTLISTVFAMSIVMSQLLININPSFWYLDPALSIVLAIFMAGFGIKVIHQNFNILKPIYYHHHNQGHDNNNSANNNSSISYDELSSHGLNSIDTESLIRFDKLKSNSNKMRSTTQTSGRPTLNQFENKWQNRNYSTITMD